MNRSTPVICTVAILCHIILFVGESRKVVLWEDAVFWLVIFPFPMAVLGVMGFFERKTCLPLLITSLLLTSLWIYAVLIYLTKGLDSQGGMGLVVLGILQWGIVILFLIAAAVRKYL